MTPWLPIGVSIFALLAPARLQDLELGGVQTLGAEVEAEVARLLVGGEFAAGRIGSPARFLHTTTRRQAGIALGASRGLGVPLDSPTAIA